MPRLSHNASVSQKDNKCRCPDNDISFDPTTKKKQQDTTTYHGIRVGGNITKSSKVIVKFSKDGSIMSQEWAGEEQKRAIDANVVAKLFNKMLRHLNLIKMQKSERRQDIQFQVPYLAQVDRVASFDRSIKENETCLIQDKISNPQKFICTSCDNKVSKKDKIKHSKCVKKLKKFSSSVNDIHETVASISRYRHFSEGDKESALPCTFDGKRLSFDDVPKQFILRSESTRNLHTRNIQYKELHAFVHYFFCHYNGDIAIDHLEGEYEDDTGYTLSVPTYHSKDQRFGNNDNGVHGILRVIQNHECTDLCRHLPEMRLETTVIPLPRSRLCG